MSPVRDVIESLAVSVLSHPEFTQFKKLVYQYEHQELPVEDFAKELLRLLDRPEKVCNSWEWVCIYVCVFAFGAVEYFVFVLYSVGGLLGACTSMCCSA